MTISRILKVAIPTPLRKTFDYLAPDKKVQIGARIKVPFGKREVIGIVVGFSEKSDVPSEKLKKPLSVIDTVPLLDECLLSLYRWSSDYYQHPIGEVIVGTLPKKIREGVQKNPSDSYGEDKESKAIDSDTMLVLTAEQSYVIHQIKQACQFQPFLLFGVTGSGKTEVYLQVIAETLKQNKQALVLVPEISLTPQTVERFQKRFDVPVLVLHSGLTASKRFQSWVQATVNQPCIVIGTRSAVFAPLKNVGIIVIDEEHDVSFKQQTGFRYSARDVAIMRAKLLKIPIVLGTATPSLESLKNAEEKKYHLLRLTQRAGKNTHLPVITTHDIRSEKLRNGLSEKLLSVMRQHLNNGNQVLLYLNRRGYAAVLMCHHCGWSASCPHCDAQLTAHHHPKKLLCHHCGYQMSLMRICKRCQQSELILLGVGTEQLEETLRTLFPQQTIARVDRDCIKNLKMLEQTLSKIHKKEIDIVIGTQMLVKGHHFENVTLVAAIDVDHALFASDFRAVERLGQSLIQVSGRAGRAEKMGEVFIQTRHPNHALLEKLFSNGYGDFTDSILVERMKTKLPPFAYMAILRAEAKNQKRVELFLSQAKLFFLKQVVFIEIAGPMPVAITKKAGVYRMQLVLQSCHRSALQKILSIFMLSQTEQKKIAGLRWMIDVDPMEMG